LQSERYLNQELFDYLTEKKAEKLKLENSSVLKNLEAKLGEHNKWFQP